MIKFCFPENFDIIINLYKDFELDNTLFGILSLCSSFIEYLETSASAYVIIQN